MDIESTHVPARYVNIAMDIATRIVRGEYREGQKIFGRSTLAGKYNVSPETIRRALTLLQDTGVVHVAAGVGVLVKSQREAETFIAQCGQKQVLRDVQERLHHLLRERDRLNTEIDKLLNELLEFTFKMAGRLKRIEEIKVLAHSPLAGKSLAQAEFRGKTGATVVAVYRNGAEIFSPPPETVIQAGDALIIVSPQETGEDLVNMVNPVSVEKTTE